jgi:hypothetical protein
VEEVLLMVGKTLGHYQITSRLGKGGIGEVYRAKDQKLGREVAIKVLPEEFAKDADRVARFQREAKLHASLNHPKIAAIHGLEESGGSNFLVLERVEGRTLADRLRGGSIPAEESLKLALQIAEALEAAHEKGVIHRDLKPSYPIGTPDGRRIASAKRMAAGNVIKDMYWKAADGTGEEEMLGSAPERALLPWSWSSDGNTLFLSALHPGGGFVFDIGTLSMKGNREWRPLLNQKYNELHPRISPDGKWMAYPSDESGRYEIYVHAFPDVNKGRWQVSTSGGDTPLWSPDGRELFYQSDDAVMGVSAEAEPTFKAGKPETLFRGTYVRFPTSVYDTQPWDIHPDGKRFLMLKPSSSTRAAPAADVPRKINIVLNWLEELKRRVPVK